MSLGFTFFELFGLPAFSSFLGFFWAFFEPDTPHRCDGRMVRSRFRRTEEEQCGGNSHPQRTLTTNNDESIFTTVTKCHKKHTLTRSRPRSHSRAAAPPTSPAHARASPARRRQLPRRTAAHRNDMHTPAYIQTYTTTGATASTDSARPSHTQMCHMSHRAGV